MHKVQFPTENEIARRAFEMFFAERASPRSFQEYRRLAETELLERAARKALMRRRDGTPRQRRP